MPPSPVVWQTTTFPSTVIGADPTILHATPCINDLLLVSDPTIPDNTVVSPGMSLDKQWLVRNNGTCDWDGTYTLRFVGGSLLDASPEFSLIPAVSGNEGSIEVKCTAPLESGQYISLWQAFDPLGNPFGEIFQMTIVVEP